MLTYRETGKAGPWAVPAILLLLVGAVGAAFVYQRVITWIPLIYVNALVTFGFGIGLGLGIQWLLHKARNRNRVLAVAGAALAGLVAVASSFWWAYTLESKEFHAETLQLAKAEEADASAIEHLSDFRSMFTFRAWMDLRVENGWTVGRETGGNANKPSLSGTTVYVIWLIEAAIIVGLAVTRAAKGHGDPFCEACERWPTQALLGPWVRPDADALRAAVKAGDVDALLRPVPLESAPPTLAVYVLHACSTCEESRWVDVRLVTVVPTKKGQAKETTEPLASGVELTPAQVAALLAYRYPDLPDPDSPREAKV